MAIISEKAKVEELENAVVHGTAEQVSEILAKYKKFDILARALGLACLYGGIDKVKLLIEYGADFGYYDTNSMRSRYGIVYRSRTAEYYAYYHLMAVYTGINVLVPLLSADIKKYHFGYLPEYDVPYVSDEQRAEIVRYLCSKPDIYFFLPDLLYYAVLWNCTPAIQVLKEHNAPISDKLIDGVTSSGNSLERSELWATLTAMPCSDCVQVIKTFADILSLHGKKIFVPPYVVQNASTQWITSVLTAVYPLVDSSALNRSELLCRAIRENSPELLDFCLEHGFADNGTTFKNALKCAQDNRNVTATAMLLEYNNKKRS